MAVGFFGGFGDVAGGDRTVKLAGFARLADDDQLHAVQLRRRASAALLRSLGVLRFKLGALLFKQFEIGFGRAQRLLVRQQEIAGKTGADLDDLAHLAQALDAFQKNDFDHDFLLF